MIYLVMSKNFVLLKVFRCQIWMKKYRFGDVQEEKGGLSLIFTITVQKFFMLLLTKYVWRWITGFVKEVTLCWITSHVLTLRTLFPSLMLISLLVLLISIMQTFLMMTV